jgi:hypothetical protein
VAVGGFLINSLIKDRKRKQPTEIMPAPRKWVPRPISEADIAAAEAYKAFYGPKADKATRKRVREDFTSFKRINHPYDDPEDPTAIWYLWIAQMTRGGDQPSSTGLAAGTIEDYVHMANPPAEVAKAAQHAHADALTGHAADVSDETLCTLVEDASNADHGTMFVMLCTGCHASDAQKLRPCQIEHERDAAGHCVLTVTWFWTKSGSKRKTRTTQTYPGVMVAEQRFLQLLDGSEDKRPFNRTAAQLNKYLSPFTTSLVFRRALEHRTKRLGWSVQQQADALTHQSTQMVKAHYGQTIVPKKKK